MHVDLPVAIELEKSYLELNPFFRAPGVGGFKGGMYILSKSGKSIDSLDVSHYEVITIKEGEVSRLSTITELRFLTSLIAIIIAGDSVAKSSELNMLKDLREYALTQPCIFNAMSTDSEETSFSAKGKSYNTAEDLFELASLGGCEDVLYLGGVITEYLRAIKRFPKGAYGALQMLRVIKTYFEWDGDLEGFRLDKDGKPEVLRRQFERALALMKSRGFEFKFEAECRYLLSNLHSGGVLFKLKPKGGLRLPAAS